MNQSSLSLPFNLCTYVKVTHKPLPKEKVGEHVNKFSGEVHMDMWGPSLIKSFRGKLYYASFTDDRTMYTQLYLLAHKRDTFEAYLSFKAWANTQHSAKSLRLYLD